MELLIFIGFISVVVAFAAFLAKVTGEMFFLLSAKIFNIKYFETKKHPVLKGATKAAPAATSNLKSIDMDIMSITIPSKLLEAVDYSKYESPTYLRKGGVVF